MNLAAQDLPRWTGERIAGLLFGLGVGTVIGYCLRSSRRHRADNGIRREPMYGAVYDDEITEDIVDRASEDSFPASDAPAY